MPDLGMSWEEALAYGEETSAKSHYIKDARLMAQQKYDLGRNSSWMFTKHGVPLQIRNMEKLKQFLDAGEQIHYQPVACYDGGDGSRTIQFFLNQIASDDAYKNVEVRTETRGVALLMSDERTVEGIQTKGAMASMLTSAPKRSSSPAVACQTISSCCRTTQART